MSMSLKLITCPYNPCHQIRPERIQYHLIKCEKHHPHADLVVCPYNATHHIPRLEEHEHIQSCPDRRIIELQRYRMNEPVPGQHGMLANPAVFGSSSIPLMETEVQRPRRRSSAIDPFGNDLSVRLADISFGEDPEVRALTSAASVEGGERWRRRTSPSPLRRPTNLQQRARSPSNRGASPTQSSTGIFTHGPTTSQSVKRKTSPYPAKRHNSPMLPRTSSVNMGGGDRLESLNISVSEIARLESHNASMATEKNPGVRQWIDGMPDRISVTPSLAQEDQEPSMAELVRGRGRGRRLVDIVARLRQPGAPAASDAASVTSTHAAFDVSRDAGEFEDFPV